jgi:hypothetical protein
MDSPVNRRGSPKNRKLFAKGLLIRSVLGVWDHTLASDDENAFCFTGIGNDLEFVGLRGIAFSLSADREAGNEGGGEIETDETVGQGV